MKRTILSLAALLVMGTYTYAGVVTTDLSVTANVPPPPVLTLEASGEITFGLYLGAQIEDLGSIKVTRSNDSEPVRIKLGKGLAGSYNHRKMFAGSEFLNYNLYCTQTGALWGDGTDGTAYPTWPANNGELEKVYSITGRLFGNQSPPPGNYSDTVVVTAEY